jgi:hypothetical protein
MAKKIGPCCICGRLGPLSFEHVPPRAAYNDCRVFEADVKRLVGGGWDALKNPSGKYSQRGAGKYTLCERCNSTTGAWYGSDYVRWAQQGMTLLAASQGRLTLSYPFPIYPLRVLKQLATMFFSACGSEFHKHHVDLVRFVLNKEAKHLPEGFRIYCFFQHPTESTASRQSGLTGVLNFEHARHRQYVFSEIVFPPYGFVMTVDTPPIDSRLCDITDFGSFEYKHRQTLYLRLPVLPVVSWLPADFRDEREIKLALDAANTGY